MDNVGLTARVAPLAIDLCCGLGGWTRGLQAAGYRVLGVDSEPFGGCYPGEYFIRQDVRTLTGKQFRGAVLIVASPPCQQFSYRSFPFRKCRGLPPPVSGLELFHACERIGREAGIPYVIENVRGAVTWVGPPVTHLGPFYLWGTGVPAVLPPEFRQFVKGFTRAVRRGGASNQTSGQRMGKTLLGQGSNGRMYGSKSAKRREWSARIAMIPDELGRYLGEVWYP